MSDKHKFCFIHVERCAGTTIRDTLSKMLNIPHFKSPGYLGPMKGQGGQRAIDYINLLGEEKYKTYYSFAFVRNPYERLVSWFAYDDFGIKVFEEWLIYFFDNYNLTQMAYLVDENGDIAVDFIGKVENLQEDFNRVCEKLKIYRVELPVKNASNHADYKTYYTPETLQIVNKVLNAEIQLFGYNF